MNEKVEKFEIKLKNKGENDLIKELNNRDIEEDEKKELLKNFDSQKIFFGGGKKKDEVIQYLYETENLLKKKLEYIQKLIKNDVIKIKNFNKIHKNLKNKIDDIDFLYKVEDKYCDEDFLNYLSELRKNINNFKDKFYIFTNKYNFISETDFEDIDIKDFSLPNLHDESSCDFNLNTIDKMSNVLATPIIIKKNNELICNYKKIFHNTGSISPELFNESVYRLLIYSLVNEELNAKIEEEIKPKNDGKEKIIELYDTNKIHYIKLKTSKISPESSLEIDICLPPPNRTKEIKTYRLKRNLIISLDSIFVKIIIEIIFIVCPLKIDFLCEQYSLSLEREQYKLNTSILLKDEIINFKIKNYYENIPFKLKHSIKSLDKNSCDKPEIEIKNETEINVKIKKNDDEFSVLNCLLEIYISRNIKISILINSLIILTYFDFYIYDYETKEFVTDKNYIYIPTFEDKCEIELNFLISTFSGLNNIGLFKISDISDGVEEVPSENKIRINSKEKYIKKKLKFNMNIFDDEKIATFEFKINNVIKKIELFQKRQNIQKINNFKLIKTISDENPKHIIENLNVIYKYSSYLLISPFACWGKKEFLYRQCYINGQKDLNIELTENLVLYYLTNEGYIKNAKRNDNYLIIIKKGRQWYSTIGSVNYISFIDFKNILMKYLENFYKDFLKFFPDEKIKNDLNYIIKLFDNKSKILINDKKYVCQLINSKKNIINKERYKKYYDFRDTNPFIISDKLRKKIDSIKDFENNLNIATTYLNDAPDEVINSDYSEDSDDSDGSSKENSNNPNYISKIKGKEFSIQNGIPKKKKKNNKKNISETIIKTIDFGENEVNNIEIKEINVINIPKIITINSLIKFFDECSFGALILPLYIFKAKKSENKKEQKNAQKYFTILRNAYLSIKNQNNIISEFTNYFKIRFEYMISKLIEAGYKPDSSLSHIKPINFKDNDIIIFPPNREYNVPNYYFTKKDLPKNKKKEKYHEKEKSVSKNIFNSNNKFHFTIPKVVLPLEEIQETQKIIINDIEKSKNIKKNKQNKKTNIEGLSLNQNQFKKEITKKEFDKKDFNFNIKIEIKAIINHIKNKDKKQFLYKKDKELIFLDNVSKYIKKEEGDENEIKGLIESTKPLTKKLIKEISFKHCRKEINLNKIEITILFDCSRIIDIYHKYLFFILIIGLTNALSELEMNYRFAIVGDGQFKAIIKELNEEHSEKVLKRIYDCITIQRYRTNIASCVKVALNKFHRKNKRSVFYVFTNGLDDEYYLYNEWNKEIFNDKNCFFSFLFYLPKGEKEDIIFISEQLNQFSKNCNSNKNLWTFIINDNEMIFKNKMITEEVINSFINPILSKENDDKLEKSKQYSAKFEISGKKENFSNKFEDIKEEIKINEEEENEDIFVYENSEKEESNNFTLNKNELNQNESKEKEFKEIESNIGNIIPLSFIPDSIKFIQSLSDYIQNDFKIPKEEINFQLLEIIFEPNLPTETILSEIGTQIDIYEFIKFCINQTPNPKIYRQLGDGFIKNYGLTIVVDSSYSCLGGISRNHTINTIRYLLSSISYIDLPSFNLIISTETNPIVICSEKGTLNALSNKSQIWGALFYFLIREYKCININLSSAIRAAYNIINARKQEHKDYLFILTDGLLLESERKKVSEEIKLCKSKGLDIIGIGVGLYPFGIEDLFPFIVYSRNPSKIIEGISLCFSEHKNISHLILKDPNYSNDFINKLSENKKSFLKFKNYESDSSLAKHLNEIKIFLNSYSFSVPEISKDDSGYLGIVGNKIQNAMYDKDFLKNYTILIVMLYSSEMNTKENPHLSYNYINEPPPGQNYCIKNILEYLGIKVDLAIDYRTAIEKLTKKNKYCDYYACLILSGEPYPELPPNEKEKFTYNHEGAYLLGEFIRVIIQFWKNGGGLGLFSDNAPFTFQTNLILEELEKLLPIPNTFRIGGSHEGKKILEGIEDKNLKKGTFNRNIIFVGDKYQRPRISHNLYKMYEGNTVSYIIENPNNKEILYFGKNEDLKMVTNPERLKPFIPFSKDSDGGFNSIFYCSNGKEGDIIIDCSYTKFFLEMDKTGTPRYFLNICSWLAAYEKQYIKGKKSTPKYIDFKINYKDKFNKFMERKDKRIEYMKTLFAIDNSGSVHKKLIYFNKIKEIFSKFFNEERGDTFYTWSNRFKKLKYEEIFNFINKMEGNGSTCSNLIAEISKIENNNCDNKFEHLIIISDGEVDQSEVDKSDKKFEEYKLQFSHVSTFLVNTGGNINESVGCPYSRNCPGFTYLIDSRGNQIVKASLYPKDLDTFKNLNNIKSYYEFESIFDSIYRVFRAKCLEKNLQSNLKNKFEEFKKNINPPKNKINSFNDMVGKIDSMINGDLRDFQQTAC